MPDNKLLFNCKEVSVFNAPNKEGMVPTGKNRKELAMKYRC